MKCSLIQALRKDFKTLEMKKGENINGYFASVVTLSNKKKVTGEHMKDITIVDNILRTSIEKFADVVVSIE